jgi:demethylmenaquinone methyltransferase / 2-methoxy-6-polyprenyl-1,4-benzoquinol methylase
MFDDIAGSYDFLNHLLSLNVDKSWRRKAIRSLSEVHPKQILDMASGTGDLAITALSLDPDHITGVDVSTGMLEVGRKKIVKMGMEDRISFVEASCENLPFPESSFDAAMVAFGVRNFTDPDRGLRELFRVLRPGGKLVILEFSLPENKGIRALYRIYFHWILPLIGKIFSRDMEAYRYLPESVEAFHKGDAFVSMLDRAGFNEPTYQPLTNGICGLYTGMKYD